MSTEFTQHQKAGLRELVGKLQEATEGMSIEPFSQAECAVMYWLVVLVNQKSSAVLPLLEELIGSGDLFLEIVDRLRVEVEQEANEKTLDQKAFRQNHGSYSQRL